ncbi:MAG: RluA family pseudouridine synthase [bacterium]|nr:RluA family pseudouridine synthase [bacterium]
MTSPVDATDERVEVVVPPAAVGERLDRFLGGLPAVGTRSRAQQLLLAERVTVDGRARRASYTLRGGERVVALVPPPPPSTLLAEALPLSVLFEDAHLVALDKAPGMVVHPAPGARTGTVVNALLHRLGALEGGDPARPGIVHRLDRDTSGVLVVARTPRAHEYLARQFRKRTLSKRYVAVVHGRLAPARGTVDRAIARDVVDRKRMRVVREGGRAAVTRWEVLEYLPGATLVALVPETGRTHQLRVHLASLGHPIAADRVYGGDRLRTAGVSARVAAVLGACPRQALHAEALRFRHPGSGEAMEIAAPWPADLRALVEGLRALGGGHDPA